MNATRVITKRWPSSATRATWARLLGMSYMTLMKAEDDGKIQTYRALNNRYVMIDREEICKWLQVTYAYEPKQ